MGAHQQPLTACCRPVIVKPQNQPAIPGEGYEVAIVLDEPKRLESTCKAKRRSRRRLVIRNSFKSATLNGCQAGKNLRTSRARVRVICGQTETSYGNWYSERLSPCYPRRKGQSSRVTARPTELANIPISWPSPVSAVCRPLCLMSLASAICRLLQKSNPRGDRSI